eukprot:CAMPEP_0118932096 /NCGR_PEP_ID=MMETSP1169-20130426/9086_1 /TAXON_ID=36882 /ORGANISM="Pyramimonas obovata, Strain CCMP722" /LENGTH=239 /DNA_ID=CAMNT_0006874701 /DNA_START=252 /DNA_END=968 /DNA_ORIENTATION=+
MTSLQRVGHASITSSRYDGGGGSLAVRRRCQTRLGLFERRRQRIVLLRAHKQVIPLHRSRTVRVENILQERVDTTRAPTKRRTIRVRVKCPHIRADDTRMVLGIVGEGDVLGNWCGEHAVMMKRCDWPYWQVDRPADEGVYEYKYVIFDGSASPAHPTVHWETSRGNRKLAPPPRGCSQAEPWLWFDGHFNSTEPGEWVEDHQLGDTWAPHAHVAAPPHPSGPRRTVTDPSPMFGSQSP